MRKISFDFCIKYILKFDMPLNKSKKPIKNVEYGLFNYLQF